MPKADGSLYAWEDPSRPYTPEQRERMRLFHEKSQTWNAEQKRLAAERRAAAGTPEAKATRKNKKPAWATREGKTEALKTQLINLVTHGESFAGACRTAQISDSYLAKLRKNYSDFNEQLLAAKAGADAEKTKAKGAPDAESDFVTFRLDYFQRDTAPHHLLMTEQLERAKPGEIVLVLGFPGMGKSSVIVDYINFRVALNPNIRIATISEGQDLARKLLGQIADRMTDTQRFAKYIAHFGPFRAPIGSIQKDYIGRVTGNPWTADYLRVFKADHDEKEMTVESKGVGSKLYGGRYDLMIYDDLQSTRNLSQTGNIMTWLRQDALTRPGHQDGGNIIIGSRVGRGDLYETLVDEQMVTRTVTIPALDRWVDRDDMYVVRNGQVIVNPNCPAKPTWDAWSLQSLAQRRQLVKEEIWTRTYMQMNYTPKDATFTEDMLDKAKDRNLKVGETRGTYRILSVDPALDSGICAFLTASCAEDDLWLGDLITSRTIRRYEDIYAQIASIAARFRPNVVVVEQNNFQKGMLQDDRLIALSKRFGFKVQGHVTNRNKHDPVMGVAMMASAFTDDELHIPWADQTAVETFGPMLDELRAWTPSKRGSQQKMDTVMTLWFAWLQWESVRHTILGSGGGTPQRQVPSWMRSTRRGIA